MIVSRLSARSFLRRGFNVRNFSLHPKRCIPLVSSIGSPRHFYTSANLLHRNHSGDSGSPQMSDLPPQDFSDIELVQLARGAMKRAHCPYSKFPVGAALLTESGHVIFGCNVENASYGGTICAERSAIVSAVSQGFTRFRAIAVVTELNEPAAPCGLCRQFLIEFGNYKVVIGTASNSRLNVTTTRDLLPYAFTPDSLTTFENEKTKSEIPDDKTTTVAAGSD